MDGSLAVLERAEIRIRYRTYSPIFNGPDSFPDGFRHVLATVSSVIPLLACLRDRFVEKRGSSIHWILHVLILPLSFWLFLMEGYIPCI